jgi:lysozyme
MIDRLIPQLKKSEGVRKFAYQCVSNKWTIGVGRNIDKDGGIGLSDDEIDYLLTNDINRVTKEAKEVFNDFDKLPEDVQIVIVDMIFNMGKTRFLNFKNTIDLIKQKKYTEASDEMLKSIWAKQVGNRAIELSHLMRRAR